MSQVNSPLRRVEIHGVNYRHYRRHAEEVRARLSEAIRDAHEAGATESEIARIAGVTRMTVRKALGK